MDPKGGHEVADETGVDNVGGDVARLFNELLSAPPYLVDLRELRDDVRVPRNRAQARARAADRTRCGWALC